MMARPGVPASCDDNIQAPFASNKSVFSIIQPSTLTAASIQMHGKKLEKNAQSEILAPEEPSRTGILLLFWQRGWIS
jgi:hypothetical protein